MLRVQVSRLRKALGDGNGNGNGEPRLLARPPGYLIRVEDGELDLHVGWILPEVLDPDGHTLRFYTTEHHTDLAASEVTTIHDPRETAERLEREEAARTANA